ncbi:multidrug resistance-associated protein 5 [Aplysia californica]|uniref:Multidrug resistance-associated protein 5 n=1 Tax=Aplysia californica TaxID=6500 RepID=A0ABM1A221_APLCA|nr:multidrug resistance-associated protein 5 [Aplysia californica]XP_012939244.1 multidrug resistance-associated protein 5 [Aplysia californica]XP_035826226.1 multidrug resistance-associated protein 5 [Aplysia californica]
MADEEGETFLRRAEAGDNSMLSASVIEPPEEETESSSSKRGETDEPTVNVRQGGTWRYSQALKTLLPLRCSKYPENALPLDSIGFLSFITFAWLTRYMWRVYKRGVDEIRGLEMRHKDSADAGARRMGKFWLEEITVHGTEEASFGRVMFRAFRTRIFIGLIGMVMQSLLVLAIPIFAIRYFLDYLSDGDVSVSSGIGYVIALALIILLNGLVSGFIWMVNFEAAARIKYGSLALLYKKVLRVKNFQDKTVGDLVNFISNDSQRIWDAIIMGPFATGVPVVLILSCIYSVILLGPWALVGWFLTVGFFPFLVTCAKLAMKYREISIKLTDKRVGFTNELLTCIKFVKMYAWEECFGQKIKDVRAGEEKILRKSVFLQSVTMGSSMLIPIFASCVTFIAYVATGNNLTPSKAFTYVSLMNAMQGALTALPFALKSLSEVTVTVARMKEILLLDEVVENSQPLLDDSNALEVMNANCTWSVRKTGEVAQDTIKEPKKKQKNKKKAATEEELAMTDDLNKESGGQIYTAPVLRNITFTLKKGELLGICGHVGCGKSSLITALLGRMDVSSGTIAMTGSVAYVSQQAWITNDSVKNNILFGNDYDEDRYKSVIEACALKQDIDSLAAGDESEVGERGATLSGGQKQRISLARAAYSKCDLIFLDDPLSSVDVHIGQHLFEHCIMGLMKGSTVVLVTHQLQYLKHCTSVLVMKEGKVVEQGPHSELMSVNGEYASLLNLYNQEKKRKTTNSRSESSNRDRSSESEPLSSDPQDSSLDHTGSNGDAGLSSPDVSLSLNFMEELTKKDTDPFLSQKYEQEQEFEGQLTEQEEMESGSLRWPVIRQYIQASGGFVWFLCVLLFFSLPVAGVTTAGWYLTYWLEQGGGDSNMTMGNITLPSMRVVDHPDKNTYLGIYASFIPLLIVLMLMRSLLLTKTVLKAATCLHNKAFTKVLRCPMPFFDSTPLGRIVNRFSADLDEIDMRLPMNAEIFLTNILQVIAGLAMIAYVSPWFLIALVPFGALFFFLMVLFHTCVTVMKRFDNVSRSPVISHMGASFQGVATIQAYQRTDQFIQKHCDLLNDNSVPVFLFYAANRWLAVRMDVLSAAIAFITGLLVLLTFEHLNTALAGLAISYSVQMSGLFQFTARLFIETEARFTSVQRILKYCNLTRQEPTLPEADTLDKWPSEGHVEFDCVKMKYRDNLPLALNDVTFSAAPHEKIGIVGRTAAGKSSLAVAMFRLVELDQGHIYVDDVDISNIDLTILRSKISIIPQDPVLFSGTLRYNLDPFQQFCDADIWQALSKCHIEDMVKSFEHQLSTSVEEAGGNFSLGERQLLCMARALLRNSKVLILDEATAAIDTETDALIQCTLKEAFSECTMLIIAHRLNTVTSCDKILVMKNGKVQEFNTPSKLLADPHSEFRSMLEAAEDLD